MIHLSRITAFSAALLTLAISSTPLRAVEKASIKSRVAATQTVSFDVYIPLRNRAQLDKDLVDLQDVNSPNYHKWLTPAEAKARYAASPAQVEAIRSQLAAYGLTATTVNSLRIHVTGPAGAVEQAFATTLGNGAFSDGKQTVAALQPLVKSGAIAASHALVSGLSGVIRMKQHSYPMASPQNRYSNLGPYWFDDLKQAYSFPSYQAYDGTGVTIGILMTGGFNQHDMDLYFNHEHIASPNFSTVIVDGGLPYDPTHPFNSFETHLDLQQSGGMAPKANGILYDIPDLSDGSIIDGLFQIVDDDTADVVSMSFGGPEYYFTPRANDGEDFTDILQFEDEIFAYGNSLGITFIASSGDAGAKSAVPVGCFSGGPNCGSFLLSVEFPASSPHVVGVGGTNLLTRSGEPPRSLDSTYRGENALADVLTQDIFYGTSATGGYWGSGGGISTIFAKPAYQNLVQTGENVYRTVPDVSLHMGGCPGGAICNPNDSADLEVIAGTLYGVIGTSASAPDFAGLTALAIQRYGSRLGNENYYIYNLANAQAGGAISGVFNQIGIRCFNGYYYGNGPGYNKVIGNGTVNGRNFLLAPVPVAGIPQTPSNP